MARSFYEKGDRDIRGKVLRQGITERGLVNPLLGCEIGPQDSFQELKPTKEVLQAKVLELQKNNSILHASVYLRTLNSGRWIGINEDEPYAPASMLKVIVMISYFKQAEKNPDLLNARIQIHIDKNIKSNVPKGAELSDATYYTISELIEHMIVYSDNVALNELIDHSDPKHLEETFTTLGFPVPKDTKTLNDFSSKQYSTIFRTLYSASYMNVEMSERALDLLRKTEFKMGIAAPIPPSISVAHKFGVRQVDADTELHDCGIVYYPQHPYFLCVMTKGKDLSKQAAAIQEISKTAYTELDTFFKSEE